MKISKPTKYKGLILGGGGDKLPNAIVTKLPNENIQNYQLQMIDSGGGGGGVNYQMQIVTKLPNENIQNYQLQMIHSGGGGAVNYQTQIVTKLPNEISKVPTTNDPFWRGGGELPNTNYQIGSLG